MSIKNKNIKPLYQVLREESVRDCFNDITRSIALDSFTVTPVFEGEYIVYIKSHPILFEIYKKWVLGQNPIPDYSLKDEDFYCLRNEIIQKPIEEVLMFLLDTLTPGLELKILKNLEYWREDVDYKDENILKKLILKVLLETLKINSKENVKEEGYPDFVVSFLDKFQYVLFSLLNLKHLELYTIASDDEFKKSFEGEWKRLCLYQDGLYGILSVLGSNFILMDKKLSISLDNVLFPLQIISRDLKADNSTF